MDFQPPMQWGFGVSKYFEWIYNLQFTITMNDYC